MKILKGHTTLASAPFFNKREAISSRREIWVSLFDFRAAITCNDVRAGGVNINYFLQLVYILFSLISKQSYLNTSFQTHFSKFKFATINSMFYKLQMNSHIVQSHDKKNHEGETKLLF